MALDEAIYQEVSSGNSPPTLRFYTWDQPSISIGYFQNPFKDLNLDLIKMKNIPWVRRMTGGRGIFHFIELTYSISAPINVTIANPTGSPTFFPNHIKGTYLKISQGFQKGFEKLGFPIQLYSNPPEPSNVSKKPNPLCFSTPSWYEPMIDGKKVMGSAQRRFKNGFLQQGAILLNHKFEDFCHFFQLTPEDSHNFIGISDFLKKDILLSDLEAAIIAGLEEAWGILFKRGEPTDRESDLCEKLTRQKYATEEWNMLRKVHG